MNQNNRNEISRMYYSQFIIVLALFLVFIALVMVSVASLFQTEQAFQPLNDPTIVLFGVQIGSYLSIFFAFIAQYTQNVALYIKKHFCKNTVVFKSELPFVGEIEFTDTKAADFAFWVSFGIDSLTNVVWFYRTVEIPKDVILGAMLMIIGYSTMIGSTFAEEAIGVVLDALKKARQQLSDIAKQEKRMRMRESSENQREDFEPEKQSNRSQPQQNQHQERERRPDTQQNRPNMQRPQPQSQFQAPDKQGERRGSNNGHRPSYEDPRMDRSGYGN